jgi:hypothetical protein
VAVSPISKLPEAEQQKLLDDLNYLNTAEIKSFCRQHSIPYTIAIETEGGRRRRTKDDDRKGVMLDRIRHFLQTGAIPEETCFRAAVVCFDPLQGRLTENDRLFYGQYGKTNSTMISLLKGLTQGRFENGAIARILARHFWSTGVAPTCKEYASAWLQASREHTRPNPEWAFLADKASKGAGAGWKSLRANKAKRVTKVLRKITFGLKTL